MTASAIQGIQVAIHECQYQFKTHRWNCTSLERKNKNPHSSPLLARGTFHQYKTNKAKHLSKHSCLTGYKETAFAYAIFAAGVVTQVARACSIGKLTTCGCLPVLDQRTNQWYWKGCDHNVDFANTFTHRFLDSKDGAKDFTSKVNRHNNKVGRNVSISLKFINFCYLLLIVQHFITRWILILKCQVNFRLITNCQFL